MRIHFGTAWYFVSVDHLLDRFGKSAHPGGRVDKFFPNKHGLGSFADFSKWHVWNRVPKFVVVVSTHVPVHFC